MKILIGPLLPDENKRINDVATLAEIAGELVHTYDFRTFNLKYKKNNKTFFINDFQEIINLLPENWYPDIVIFWRPEYEYVPRNIEKVKCPVIAVIGDWYLGYDHILANIKLFDHVFTDKKGIGIIKSSGFENAWYFPMWAYDPSLHKSEPESEKIYDITFTGKLNHNIHYERAKWLYRLAKLSDKYKIKIFSGIFREDYVKILNQSKITFNYAMKHELNMRSYEALACKSLLFNEEENIESPELFEDKKHCVYYNSNNFEKLIDLYLTDEKKRKTIVKEGYNKVESETYQNHFQGLIEKIKKLTLTDRTDLSETEYLKQRVRSISINFFSADDIKEYLKETLHLFSNVETEERSFFNNKAVLFAEMWSIEETADKKNICFTEAVNNLTKSLNISEEVPPLYNLALLYLLNTNYENAKRLFHKVIDKFNYQVKYQPDYLLYKNNSAQFNREFNEALYSEKKLTDELYKKLLLWKSNEFLGYINELQRNFNKAVSFYTNSLSFKPHIGTVRFRLAKLQFVTGNADMAIESFKLVLENEPFFMANWFSLLEALQKTQRQNEKEAYIDEFIRVLNSFGTATDIENKELQKLKQKIMYYRN